MLEDVTLSHAERGVWSVGHRSNGAGMGPMLGRYELLMRVGAGGMGTVWAARLRGSRGFQKIVALKTILPRFSSDPTYERLLLDEGRLTAQVRHPNVGQILDVGEDNGVLFLAMEWIEGVSVSELLSAVEACGEQIPLPFAIRIAMQAAAGLHAAHELRDARGELVGLIHRDVSPQNILVSFDGITKVIDFGIAKMVNHGNDPATRSSLVRGKVGYLAPEQIMDAAPDRRVDIFALGIVLYVLTTGSHPFEGRGPLATLYNISQEPVTPPSAIRKDYPAELEVTVLRCLEKDRERRFATCDELVWALESSLPSDLRATDQDVAVFVRSLAGDIAAQRMRSLQAAAESTGEGIPMPVPASRAPEPENDERSASLTHDHASPTSGEAEEPRREGGTLGLLTWGAVFVASLWILFSQWRGDVPPPSPPTSFATSEVVRPTCLPKRSPSP
jgi:serine/threonine-protein kinase